MFWTPCSFRIHPAECVWYLPPFWNAHMFHSTTKRLFEDLDSHRLSLSELHRSHLKALGIILSEWSKSLSFKDDFTFHLKAVTVNSIVLNIINTQERYWLKNIEVRLKKSTLFFKGSDSFLYSFHVYFCPFLYSYFYKLSEGTECRLYLKLCIVLFLLSRSHCSRIFYFVVL